MHNTICSDLNLTLIFPIVSLKFKLPSSELWIINIQDAVSEIILNITPIFIVLFYIKKLKYNISISKFQLLKIKNLFLIYFSYEIKYRLHRRRTCSETHSRQYKDQKLNISSVFARSKIYDSYIFRYICLFLIKFNLLRLTYSVRQSFTTFSTRNLFAILQLSHKENKNIPQILIR